jgi:hypothetical protein
VHARTVVPAKAGTIDHRPAFCEERRPPRITGRFRGMGPGFRRDDHLGARPNLAYPTATAGTGSAVTDLIFSIAKREVTFFSVTVAISFL